MIIKSIPKMFDNEAEGILLFNLLATGLTPRDNIIPRITIFNTGVKTIIESIAKTIIMIKGVVSLSEILIDIISFYN